MGDLRLIIFKSEGNPCLFYLSLRLSEKKAQIGYTYEDSTVTETDARSDKVDEDNSENSESEEDEVIPDIGVFHFLPHFCFLNCTSIFKDRSCFKQCKEIN